MTSRTTIKITYCAAISRDGFIAREDGDVSWLEESSVNPEESGLAELFADADALVMGRKTYDFVFEYGSWPYEDKHTYVCTTRTLERMPGANLTFAASVADVMQDVTSKGYRHVWLLGGGQLASSFFELGLLTHLSFSEIPVLIDAGLLPFARHKLEEIPSLSKTIEDKGHFRQIEMVLANQNG
ncbi:MAG: dihydrofolate reductase family protein [Planctomycetota bacterium]